MLYIIKVTSGGIKKKFNEFLYILTGNNEVLILKISTSKTGDFFGFAFFKRIIYL